jgi:hypothetical protein
MVINKYKDSKDTKIIPDQHEHLPDLTTGRVVRGVSADTDTVTDVKRESHYSRLSKQSTLHAQYIYLNG